MGVKVVSTNLRHELPNKRESSGGGGGGSVTVDSELSLVSENPVQNKVITEALNALVPDSELSLSSEKAVQNKVITGALNSLDILFLIHSTWNQSTFSSVMDKTYAEIESAFSAGKICYVLDVEGGYGVGGFVCGLQQVGGYRVAVNMGGYTTVKNVSNENMDVLVPTYYTATNKSDYPSSTD